jgi:hypothetical protein
MMNMMKIYHDINSTQNTRAWFVGCFSIINVVNSYMHLTSTKQQYTKTLYIKVPISTTANPILLFDKNINLFKKLFAYCLM